MRLGDTDAIDALVARLHRRPGMHFGDNRTILRLSAYIDGACHALDIASGRDDMALAVMGFSRWLAAKTGSTEGHFEGALRRVCNGDEQQAHDRFFDEWDEYRRTVIQPACSVRDGHTPTLPPLAYRILSEADANPGSFHDCHVQGFRWHRDSFSFSMEMQYILEWIPPADGVDHYRFSVSEAELTFRDVDELEITMDWTRSALDAQISAIRVLESRHTPNGASQRLFEIEFSDPDALISLWSTGYELTLLRAPVLSRTQSISSPDGGQHGPQDS